MSDTLVTVDNVSKKFCRSLKKSLWYGVKDMASEITGSSNSHSELRDGEFWANKDISFELKRGESLGLIGQNGAGKTTLLRMLNGLIKPDKGWIEVRGRMQALIALGAGFNPILSGRENVYVNAAVLGIPKQEVDRKFDEIVEFSGISEFIDTPVQSYSSGMAVRLGFAVAAHMEPNILLVDEVLSVGDRSFQSKCINKIGKMRESGVSIIFVSHSMRTIGAFCERSLYLSKGNLLLDGETKKIVSEYIFDTSNTNIHNNDKKEFFGTGNIFINDVKLANKVNSYENIDGNKETDLIVYYESNIDAFNIELDVVIRDTGNEVIYQATNVFHNEVINLKKGKGKIILNFKELPINNQHVSLSLAIWSNARKELYDWKMDFDYYITGHPLSDGKIYLVPTYSVVTY